MDEPTSVARATPGNKGWANECGACHTRVDISLRWGQGPTRPATCEAKWQVCTPQVMDEPTSVARATPGNKGWAKLIPNYCLEDM